MGAFAQVTYDGIARHTSWGMLDARWARDFTLGKTSTLFGVSVNNYPTVQDPWNSTYAWQFPKPAARLANGPSASPQINGFLALESLGVTGYTLIDNTLYLESELYSAVGKQLAAMGHRVLSTNGEDMGGFHAIWLDGHVGKAANGPIDGVYRGASDHRKDGQALGW